MNQIFFNLWLAPLRGTASVCAILFAMAQHVSLTQINSLDPTAVSAKQKYLFQRLATLDSLLVALSGGADSAYLAWAAHSILGRRSLAVTALSDSFSTYDREQCLTFVRHVGLRHDFIHTRELQNPLYVANRSDRCYHCKSELFASLDRLAAARHFSAIAYGINADDIGDFRPGHRAAAEHRVLAPLLEAQMTKAEIRSLSRLAGLPTWDRPASACLASRIPYGTGVSPEVLARIEQGEAVLRELGFRQFRVRYFGEEARLEFALEELPRASEPSMLVLFRSRLREFGFQKVTVDPRGYRQGSLNEALPPDSQLRRNVE